MFHFGILLYLIAYKPILRNILKRLLLITTLAFTAHLQAETLELWSAFNGDVNHQIAKHFEESTGHRVTTREFANGNIKAELLLAKQNRNYMPDLIFLPSDYLGLHEYIALNPLPSEWIEQAKLEKTAIKSVQVHQEYMGLPLFLGNHLMLFYNKQLVQNPNLTWEQFFSYSIEHPNEQLLTFPAKDMYFFVAFMELFFQQKPLGQLDFTSQSMVQSLKFYRQLLSKLNIELECNSDCARNKFLNSEVPYLIDGDWAFESLNDTFGAQLGITNLPTYEGNAMQSLSGSKVIAVTKGAFQNPQKRELVKRFIQSMQDEAFLKRLSQKYQYISSFKQVNQEVFTASDELAFAIYNEYLVAQPMPTTLRLSFVWEVLSRGFYRYFDGMPAKEVTLYMDTLVHQFESKIESSR